MSQLTDYIVEIPDVVDPSFLPTILPTIPDEQWKAAEVGEGVVKTDIRNCQSILLRETFFNDEGLKYALDVLTRYKEKFPLLSVSADTGYEILKYQTGDFYKTHVDSFAFNPRIITMSITLNDDFEGGDWSFFDGELVIKPKLGSAVVFPSNFMYPHAILPVTRGTRYSLITWYY